MGDLTIHETTQVYFKAIVSMTSLIVSMTSLTLTNIL